ncbi:MAG: hypothetical protein JXR76_09000 [Deltaproteobacteria bacterium]|nr:hypothetical protein [Deltaproteobacteria bacterium]
MERTTRNNKIKIYYDPRTLPVEQNSNRISRLFVESANRDEPWKITVKPTLGMYELKGEVDSRQTHDIILTIVQTNHPYRDIIDYISYPDKPAA